MGQQVQANDAQVSDVIKPELVHMLLVSSLDSQWIPSPGASFICSDGHQLYVGDHAAERTPVVPGRIPGHIGMVTQVLYE